MTSEMQSPTLEAGGSNLPLKEISATGEMFPNLAILRIKQRFVNGGEPADVTYHCPLHPDWAIRKVTLKAGDQEISTVVLPKQEAAETFETAKQAGHTAVLADEVASDEMRLQLANVPAGADVEVETEVVAWPQVEAGHGCYIVPLINGPKYGGTEAQQSHFDENDPGAKNTSCRLDLTLNVTNPSSDFGTIKDGVINEEVDPVGQITVRFETEVSALWHEDSEAEAKEMEWDDDIEDEAEDETKDVATGKYLVVGVPVVRNEKKAPKWGSTALLIDHSGSMSGQGLSVAQEMCRKIADRIGDGLKLIYAFEDSCTLRWADDPALRPERMFGTSAVDAISHISTAGGTQLDKAFRKVLSDLSQRPGCITDLVVVTDALVSQMYYTELVNSIKALLEIGIAVHVILVGAAPGRFIGECMSHASGGFYIEQTGSHFDEDELQASVDRFLIGGLTLRHIKIGKNTFQCAHPVRGRPVMIALDDIEERPDKVKVKFEGIPEMTIPVTDRPEARFVWAREKVMEIVRKSWSDGVPYESRSKEIERLGVAHQILTPFTSFVGFDSTRVLDRSNVKESIAQASLPTGIDAHAFYGVAPGGPLGIGGAQGSNGMTQAFYAGSNIDSLGGSSLLLGGSSRSSCRRSLCSTAGSRSFGDPLTKSFADWTDNMPKVSSFDSKTGQMDKGGLVPTSLTEDAKWIPLVPQEVDDFISADAGVSIPSTPRHEAATLLETLLDMIRERKENGESLSNLAGDWLDAFGLTAIVIASTALKAAGLDALAGEIAKRAKSKTTTDPLSARDDVEALAEEIAAELAA